METTKTSTETIKEGRGGFVPIPNLAEIAVGHAGIYGVDADDEDAIETEVIAADIPLKEKGASQLIACEHGITDFVKDLAKNRSNHLPNTILGVYIYYLTEGVKRDFNRTWTETPYCLQEKKSLGEKAHEKGKRVLSKKDKNELIAKRNYPYYQKDIDNGVITMEEAVASMVKAAEEVKKLEDAGYFLSPNKTQGVALFDWKSEVKQKLEGDDSVLKIYSRHSIIPLVPCLENKLNKLVINSKVKKELDKSIVAGIPFVDGRNFLKNAISGWENMKEHYQPRTFHIAKINQSGKMKDRWFVVDAIRNKDKAQVLLMWDKNGVDGILE